MSVAAPEQTTPEMTYTAKQLTKSWANAGFELDGEKVILTFVNANDEARFQLPNSLDLSKVESIVYHFESHTGAINLNIWTSIEGEGEKINFWGRSGNTSYTEKIEASDVVDYIGIQVGGNDAPEEGANAVFLGITVNMKEDVEETKEFYIAKDVTFTTTAGDDNTKEIAKIELHDDYSGNGNLFVNLLPDDLKNDPVAQNFATLEGIRAVIDYFEFHVVLEEGTAAGGNSWEPQANAQAQGSNFANATWNFPYDPIGKTLIANIGQPSEGVTKEGTVKLSTDLFEEWDDPTLNYVSIQIIDAAATTPLKGSYSIKVVLK